MDLSILDPENEFPGISLNFTYMIDGFIYLGSGKMNF